METKYAIGIGVLALAGVGIYLYLNRSTAATPAGSDSSAARDASGAAVNPVGSPNASQGANDAAVIINALAEFGQRGVDAALRIREATQPRTTGGVQSSGPSAAYRAPSRVGGGAAKEF